MVRPLGCHLLLEPGRSIVAPAGVLLTRVLYTKRNRGKKFVVVDAAMNDFIRPALYDAVHPITAGAARRNGASAGERPARGYRRAGLRNRRLFLCRIGRWAKLPRAICWCCGAPALTALRGVELQCAPAPGGGAGRRRRFRVIRRRESRADLVRGE